MKIGGTLDRTTLSKLTLLAMPIILLGIAVSFSTAAANVTGAKIVCDRWPDGSDMKQFALDSIRLMHAKTEEEKAVAIWRFIRMWTAPTDGHVPREPALGDNYIDDPLKVLNVYGAHWCDGLARIMEASWRALGFRAEKLYRSGHTQADIFWKDQDGISRWHMFDVSQGWYVYDRSGHHIATPDEIALDYSLIFRPSRGPIPKKPHYYGFWNWMHTPHLARPSHPTTLNLRAGEKLTRYWTNISLPYQDNFASKGHTDFEHGPYSVTYGNGVLEYSPDLARHTYEDGLFAAPENMACAEEDGVLPNLHLRTAGQPGSVIFKIETPYIISDAWFSGHFYRKGPGDRLTMYISVDSGNSWDRVWQADRTGHSDENDIGICKKFDVYKHVPAGLITPFGHYSFLLKLEMKSSGATRDVGVDSLKITTVTQHNIFSLPQLWPGRNLITVDGNLSRDSALRVTYRWKDLLGHERQNIAVVEDAPYTYEIVTSGNKWEDVVAKSISVEAIRRSGTGNHIESKETVPTFVKDVTVAASFPTQAIVGSKLPPKLKSTREYIRDLEDPGKQVAALAGLAVLKDPSAIEAVKKVALLSIRHPNKAMAIQALYQIGGRNVLPFLKSILKKDPQVRWKSDAADKFVELQHWYATSALIGHIMADAGEQSAAPLLMAVLESIRANHDNSWETHLSLIRSLGRLGDSQAAPSIRPFLDSNPDVAAMAIWALGELGDKESIPQIRRLAEAGNYSMITLNGVEALSKLGDMKIVPKLYELLRDDDEDFRGVAASALGSMKEEQALIPLRELLARETFPWVIERAQESLRLIDHP